MCLLIHMEHMESTQMIPILEDLEGCLRYVVTQSLDLYGIKTYN
jgi:hypothetical protein